MFVRSIARGVTEMNRVWSVVNPFFRWFTRVIANRWVMRTAGRAGVNADVIHHVGRKSGREHATPVVAHPIPGGRYLIALRYGPGVDWCRNVIAAGGARMDVKGESVEVTHPSVARLLEVEAALPAETMANWGSWRTWDIACLLVDVRRTAAPASADGGSTAGASAVVD
jgi:deazaflavin-dependent oxidoreductase (nitroreductase family)